jgi:hypothetical protein
MDPINVPRFYKIVYGSKIVALKVTGVKIRDKTDDLKSIPSCLKQVLHFNCTAVSFQISIKKILTSGI